jgi:O-antigen/teichoic acid export membrane protein
MISLKTLYNRVQNSQYAYNFKKLATATILSQIIIIFSSPFITRLYSPETLGTWALFISFVSILSALVIAGYQNTIIISQDPKETDKLLISCCILVFLLSLLIFLIMIIGEEYLKKVFKAEKLYFWWNFIIFIVIIHSLIIIFQNYFNRYKKYKILARMQIYKSIIYLISVISFGYLKLSFSGLFFAELIASLSILFLLIYRSDVKNFFFLKIDIQTLQILKKYKEFPIFHLTGSFVNILTSLMPIFFLTKYFSEAIVGYYVLAFKSIFVPLNFISSTVSTLNMKKVSDLFHSKGNTIKYFFKISIILFFIIIIPGFILIMFGPEIFKFIFGKNWEIAGEFAAIVMPAAIVMFVVSPISSVLTAANKLNLYFVWSFSYFLACLIFFIFFSHDIEVKEVLKHLTKINIIFYTLYYFMLIYVIVTFKHK